MLRGLRLSIELRLQIQQGQWPELAMLKSLVNSGTALYMVDHL